MSDEVAAIPDDLRVQILTARPGDTVFLTADRTTTPEQARLIKRQLALLLPDGVNVALMMGGLRVDAVVRPGDDDDPTVGLPVRTERSIR